MQYVLYVLCQLLARKGDNASGLVGPGDVDVKKGPRVTNGSRPLIDQSIETGLARASKRRPEKLPGVLLAESGLRRRLPAVARASLKCGADVPATRLSPSLSLKSRRIAD